MFTLNWSKTRLTPNELPEMVEDAVRKVTVKAAHLASGTSISGTPTATSDTLTIGAVSVSSTTIMFNVTASQIGTHYILVTCVLANGETAKGYIRVCVRGRPLEQSDDYGDA